MKTRTVLLPIRVPEGRYCIDKSTNTKCQYFSSLVGCYNGFKPVKITSDIYKKDINCYFLQE